MKKLLLLVLLPLLTILKSYGAGEPSTYFNIYVPSNNDAVKRNVSLIVTAIQDSTYFSIQDDDMDGDSDDSIEGWLMAGQSYILYIKDNGINDDARYASGGELKSDGDYFIIQSTKLVYASMSTDSDWQHDFVAAVNKKSTGNKFYVYAPKTSNSNRDLNVFAYEDNTTFTISRISGSATLKTGYSDVKSDDEEVVVQKTINVGEDIIHKYAEGRDLMLSGHTYLIESNKPISLQYGALFGNSRDGGAYVPSSQGSSSGELFYFAVPYQASGEQEIRLVSWDDDNDISLERYSNGSWLSLGDWSKSKFGTADWVGKENNNSTYPTVFRAKCTSGKSISVFEANWMETGRIGTSDMASMMSASNGKSAGKEFLAYIAPPGNQNNVTDPFTGNKFGGSFSHLFLFAGKKNSHVRIIDAKTNGEVFNRLVTIDSARYADVAISVEDWESIYNGTGSNSGPDRPYLLVTSDEYISVLNTNFNDNWMTYFGSSLPSSFDQTSVSSVESAIPGDTIQLSTVIEVEANTILQNPEINLSVSSGAIAVSSKLTNRTTQESIEGDIIRTEQSTSVSFKNVPTIQSTDSYEISTDIMLSSSYNDGQAITDNTIISVETIVSAEVDGSLQESIIAQGIENQTSNTSALLFGQCNNQIFEDQLTDSWNSAWVDYDDDGWDDLWVTSKSRSEENVLYRNNEGVLAKYDGNGSFFNEKALTVATVWGDINNDGFPDPLTINATETSSTLYLNYGNGNFQPLPNSGLAIHPKYFHGASFADFDNDGWLDILITNFFASEFHQIYKNNGDLTFSLMEDNPIAAKSARATAPILADYDNDGLVDVFIPNGNNEANSLYRNTGNFNFEEVAGVGLDNETKNSVAASWGDYDLDGDLDLFVANSSDQNNDLYINLGNGSFVRDSESMLSNSNGHSHGVIWNDIENDGDLDLLVNNDQGANFLYINSGEGNFYLKLDEAIGSDMGSAYGVASSDYDNNGSVDYFISTHGGQENKLYCNQSNSNHWIKIQLKGVKSNRAGVGAKIRLKSGNTWQMKQVQAVSGFGSQHSLAQTFGLGTVTQVDSIEVSWPSGIKQTIVAPSVIDDALLIEEPDANSISFVAFVDSNENGIKDQAEKLVQNLSFRITPVGSLLTTNENGNASVSLPDDEYAIAIGEDISYSPLAPVSFTVNSQNSNSTVLLPLQIENLGFDLELGISRTPWRRGFKNNSLVQIRNSGTTRAESVVLTLFYPEGVYTETKDGALNEDVPNQYSMIIEGLEAGAMQSIQLEDSVGLNISTGDILFMSAMVSADGEDLDTSNNSISDNIEVVGAIDPNDLLVTPKGYGEDGWISQDQWLTFTIRFQNIGSYYATFVTLNSQLDAHFDFDSFEMVSSSHQANASLTENGTLNVFYDRIMLVSSEVNEPESHGFFKYRIKAKEDISGGAEIFNKADIVFDYEDAITTNTTKHSIQFTLGSEQLILAIYPNPSIDYVKVNTHQNYFSFENLPQISQFKIRNISGKQVLSAKDLKEDEMLLSVEDLKPGLYFIEVLDESGQTFKGKFIKK